MTLPVPLLFEPWPTNRADCGVCHTIHPCKVLHFKLDDTGAVIVSHEIKAKVFRVPQHGGFRVVGLVADPPGQTVAPDTVKVKLRGIDIGGGLQLDEPTTGHATVAAENPAPSKTVGLDEYVDTANRLGISTAVAVNVLMRHVLQGRQK
jgi:hypothetical protein